MDHARCTCTCREKPRTVCPLHGGASTKPEVPWKLSPSDREFLRAIGVVPE